MWTSTGGERWEAIALCYEEGLIHLEPGLQRDQVAEAALWTSECGRSRCRGMKYLSRWNTLAGLIRLNREPPMARNTVVPLPRGTFQNVKRHYLTGFEDVVRVRLALVTMRADVSLALFEEARILCRYEGNPALADKVGIENTDKQDVLRRVL